MRPLPAVAAGLAWGCLGVVAFSFTVPLTRVAVASLDPLAVAAGRAVVAGVVAAGAVLLTRQALPSAHQWARLAVVALGVVLGFPLLTSYALTTVPATHAAIIIAMLPAASRRPPPPRGPPSATWAWSAPSSASSRGTAAWPWDP